MRTIAVVCASVLSTLALTATGVAVASSTDRSTPVIPWWVSRECPQEDSVNCYWNGTERGNGTGPSFIVRRFDGRACYFYDRPRLHGWRDHCEPAGPR